MLLRLRIEIIATATYDVHQLDYRNGRKLMTHSIH